MAKTIAQLHTEAQTIRDATVTGENTAARVGGAIDDVVDYLNDNPNTFASSESVDDISIFDAVSDLNGKTDAEKQSMIPNGNTTIEMQNYTPSNEDFTGDADLCISDEIGNILVKFEDGGVITKNFDSSNSISQGESSVGDLTIEDEDGNVLGLFANGHIQTKYFNSAQLGFISRYKGKKVSFLGDSISTFGTPDQNNATGTWTYPNNRCRYPQNNLLTDVSKCYWYRLMEACEMRFGINESWAGSRVSNTQATDSGDLGPNRCMASTTRISHLDDNGTPDLILVYGGTNDIGNSVTIGTFDKTNPINYTESQINALPVDTFASAYRTMLIKLMYYYPTAEIVCCLPNFTNTYYQIGDLDDYIEIIKEECDFFGIKYIDLRTSGINVYNRMTYLPDGTHPNATGMALLFNKIYKQLIFT